MEDFRKDLLTKGNTYTIAQTIELGRQYEAVIASQTSLISTSVSNNDTKVDAVKHKARKHT